MSSPTNRTHHSSEQLFVGACHAGVVRISHLLDMDAPPAWQDVFDESALRSDSWDDDSEPQSMASWNARLEAAQACDDSARSAAEDSLLADLHDHSSQAAELKAAGIAFALSAKYPLNVGARGAGLLASEVLEDLPLQSPPGDGRQVTFARLCRLMGRFRLLDKLLEAGPPKFRHLNRLSPASLRLSGVGEWAALLCAGSAPPLPPTPDEIGADGTLHPGEPAKMMARMPEAQAIKLNREQAFLHEAIFPLTPSSLPVLDIWLARVARHDQASARHVACVNLPHKRPGTAHMQVLHRALNGDSLLWAGTGLAGDTEAERLSRWNRAGCPSSTSRHSVVGLEACRRLIKSGIPASLVSGEPLDMGIFLSAIRQSSADWRASVLPLMNAYIQAGILDIDRPVSHLLGGGTVHVKTERGSTVRRGMGGIHPLFSAININAVDAAHALIELGCSTDPTVVLSPAHILATVTSGDGAAPLMGTNASDTGSMGPALDEPAVARLRRALRDFPSLPPLPNGTAHDPLRSDFASLSLIDVAHHLGRPRLAGAISAALMELAARQAELETPKVEATAVKTTEPAATPSRRRAARRL